MWVRALALVSLKLCYQLTLSLRILSKGVVDYASFEYTSSSLSKPSKSQSSFLESRFGFRASEDDVELLRSVIIQDPFTDESFDFLLVAKEGDTQNNTRFVRVNCRSRGIQVKIEFPPTRPSGAPFLLDDFPSPQLDLRLSDKPSQFCSKSLGEIFGEHLKKVDSSSMNLDLGAASENVRKCFTNIPSPSGGASTKLSFVGNDKMPGLFYSQILECSDFIGEFKFDDKFALAVPACLSGLDKEFEIEPKYAPRKMNCGDLRQVVINFLRESISFEESGAKVGKQPEHRQSEAEPSESFRFSSGYAVFYPSMNRAKVSCTTPGAQLSFDVLSPKAISERASYGRLFSTSKYRQNIGDIVPVEISDLLDSICSFGNLEKVLSVEWMGLNMKTDTGGVSELEADVFSNPMNFGKSCTFPKFGSSAGVVKGSFTTYFFDPANGRSDQYLREFHHCAGWGFNVLVDFSGSGAQRVDTDVLGFNSSTCQEMSPLSTSGVVSRDCYALNRSLKVLVEKVMAILWERSEQLASVENPQRSFLRHT